MAKALLRAAGAGGERVHPLHQLLEGVDGGSPRPALAFQFNLVATLASRARRFQLAPGAPGGHANVLPRASARRNLRTAVVVATSAT